MSKLRDKVALVTGASKGIGAGIARELAASGAAVAVNYASDRAGAEAVVDAITASGGRAVALPGVVSNVDDVARLLAENWRMRSATSARSTRTCAGAVMPILIRPMAVMVRRMSPPITISSPTLRVSTSMATSSVRGGQDSLPNRKA